jgi:hypothetical protein
MEQFEEQKMIEKTLKRLSGKPAELVKQPCQSVRYAGANLQPCGSGDWLCDVCKGPGSGLKTVIFWSDRLTAWLDLTIPERDLFSFEKIMAARKIREEAKR